VNEARKKLIALATAVYYGVVACIQ